MGLLREYARLWCRSTALPLGQPNWLQLNRLRIRQIERRHPGFADELRQAALDALESDEPGLENRALATLAVVGTPADIPSIRRAGRRVGAPLEQYAREAIFEIEHPLTPLD